MLKEKYQTAVHWILFQVAEVSPSDNHLSGSEGLLFRARTVFDENLPSIYELIPRIALSLISCYTNLQLFNFRQLVFAFAWCVPIKTTSNLTFWGIEVLNLRHIHPRHTRQSLDEHLPVTNNSIILYINFGSYSYWKNTMPQIPCEQLIDQK